MMVGGHRNRFRIQRRGAAEASSLVLIRET